MEGDYDKIVSITMKQITVARTGARAAKAHPRKSWSEFIIIFLPSMNYLLSKDSEMLYEPNY